MMSTDSLAFTEFEEGITFDADDPDFVNSNISTSSDTSNTKATGNNNKSCSLEAFVSSPMSLASVHPIEMHNRDHSGLSNRSQSIGSSLEELHNCFTNSDAVLSIEELRLQLNSCFTCGVSWHEDHVSLDCRECGGYSLERPCPLCEGRCNSIWKRDLTMSHASGKARWEGECALRRQPEPNLIFKSLAAEEESLCSRLEKLGASS